MLFYINYEECKLEYQKQGLGIFEKFYINYEECKCISVKPNKIFFLGFTLTMRNVNIVVNILSSFGIVVLY